MKNSRHPNRANILIVALLMQLLVVFGFTPKVGGYEKTTVIITNFRDSTNTNMELGELARPEFTKVLLALRYFRIIEKGKIQMLINELKQSDDMFTERDLRLVAGEKLGARLVISGELFAANHTVEKIARANDSGELGEQTKLTATLILSLNIFDIQQNQIVLNRSFHGSASKIVDPNTPPPDWSTLLPQALRHAVLQTWIPVQEAYPLSGIVIKKERQGRKYQVYVDFGRDRGISTGRLLSFFNKGDKIIHPVTGEVLSSGKGNLIVQGSALEVFAEYCVVQLEKRDYKKLDIGTIVEAEPVQL